MQGSVNMMNMADLTAASGVQGVQREQCEAFLLKTGSADPEAIWLCYSGFREGLAQSNVCLGTARLIELPLRSNSSNLRAWTEPDWEEGTGRLEAACRGTYWAENGRRCVGILQSEHTKVRYFEITREGRRSATWPEREECFVVIVYDIR